MSLEKLFLNYKREEYGQEIISNSEAFISYSINGDECFISDLYSAPEARKTLASKKLFSQVLEIAKKNNCRYVTANVWLPPNPEDGGLKASKLLRCYLALGFMPIGALNNNVMLQIDLHGGK